MRAHNKGTMGLSFSRLNEHKPANSAIIINTRPMYSIFDEIESLVCHSARLQSSAKRRNGKHSDGVKIMFDALDFSCVAEPTAN